MSFSETSVIYLANQQLDAIFPEKRSDFPVLSKALRALAARVNAKGKWCKELSVERSSTALNARIQPVLELLEDPSMYVKHPQDFCHFRILVKERILAVAQQFEGMSKEEQLSYLHQCEQRREQAKIAWDAMAAKLPPSAGSTAHTLPEPTEEEEHHFEQINENIDWRRLDPHIKKLLSSGALFKEDLLDLRSNLGILGIEELETLLSTPLVLSALCSEELPARELLRYLGFVDGGSLRCLLRSLLLYRNQGKWDFSLLAPSRLFELFYEQISIEKVKGFVEFLQGKEQVQQLLGREVMPLKQAVELFQAKGEETTVKIFTFLGKKSVCSLIKRNFTTIEDVVALGSQVNKINRLLFKDNGYKLLVGRLATLPQLAAVSAMLQPLEAKALIDATTNKRYFRLRSLLKTKVCTIEQIANLGTRWRNVVRLLGFKRHFDDIRVSRVSLEELIS